MRYKRKVFCARVCVYVNVSKTIVCVQVLVCESNVCVCVCVVQRGCASMGLLGPFRTGLVIINLSLH